MIVLLKIVFLGNYSSSEQYGLYAFGYSVLLYKSVFHSICRCIKEWDLRKNFSISSSDASPKVTFTYPGLSKRRLGETQFCMYL